MANKFDNLVDHYDSQNHSGSTNPLNPVTPQDVEKETYTEEELRDVNAISVTIPDQNTPIVRPLQNKEVEGRGVLGIKGASERGGSKE
ncbi:hypothetical protein JGU42_09355 [Porphyromonas gingivalis]|uniref:hypothetical protein n=1 Tax=Porphyromonas gingivalis TaxID=837 RepID=UPI001F48274E|nr:hypothetical protein [Porphyromonas gingivalis]MCE8179448.1 hypothetical protein [Porphyromonas gingivalis]